VGRVPFRLHKGGHATITTTVGLVASSFLHPLGPLPFLRSPSRVLENSSILGVAQVALLLTKSSEAQAVAPTRSLQVVRPPHALKPVSQWEVRIMRVPLRVMPMVDGCGAMSKVVHR
jgi:hypothetical protein